MRWLAAILALLLLLAGCMGEDDNGDDGDDGNDGGDGGDGGNGGTQTTDDGHDHGDATHVEVGDDFFQVEGQATTRNGNATASVGDEFMFVNEGQRLHTVTIHKVGDALNVTVLDEEIAAGEEVGYTFAQATTYHVWCELHGTMTGGMHLTVVVS